MPKWLKRYLVMWVALVPSMVLIVGFAFFAAKYLNWWLGIVGVIIVVHLVLGWVWLCVEWEGRHE